MVTLAEKPIAPVQVGTTIETETAEEAGYGSLLEEIWIARCNPAVSAGSAAIVLLTDPGAVTSEVGAGTVSPTTS